MTKQIMAQIVVRHLDEETVDLLKERAQENGRSLQAEVKSILEGAVRIRTEDFRAAAAKIRERFKGRTFSDSAELIREDRER